MMPDGANAGAALMHDLALAGAFYGTLLIVVGVVLVRRRRKR
jgi:LPXTG-motif cell wall-anchored protein